jgi:hypothetical protein
MNIQPAKMGCIIPIILLSSLRVMAFLLIKSFGEITYQWITVTQSFIATTLFSSFVVPDPGMGVSNTVFPENHKK